MGTLIRYIEQLSSCQHAERTNALQRLVRDIPNMNGSDQLRSVRLIRPHVVASNPKHGGNALTASARILSASGLAADLVDHPSANLLTTLLLAATRLAATLPSEVIDMALQTYPIIVNAPLSRAKLLGAMLYATGHAGSPEQGDRRQPAVFQSVRQAVIDLATRELPALSGFVSESSAGRLMCEALSHASANFEQAVALHRQLMGPHR